jgi:ubiquinone/menaquinone biosynthesis C-methylase UbiE
MRYDEKAFDAFMYPLERLSLARKRRTLIPRANGVVLEIGAGTGVNLHYYQWSLVDRLTLLDVSIAESLRDSSSPDRTPVELVEGRAEDLPFADDSFDSVVFTLVFCSVDDPERGLDEVRRVLRPGGLLVFIEHVRPHDRPRFAHVVDAVNPLWHALSGECNINRNTLQSIQSAGFDVEHADHSGAGLLLSGVAHA